MVREDARIESLGRYFVYHNVLERFGIPFFTFVKMVERGDWEVFIT